MEIPHVNLLTWYFAVRRAGLHDTSTASGQCPAAHGLRANWKQLMSEIQSLSDRIDVLETRLAFQDEAIETLNTTITAQWQQIDALTRQLAALSERLQQAESNLPGAADEPPPHY